MERVRLQKPSDSEGATSLSTQVRSHPPLINSRPPDPTVTHPSLALPVVEAWPERSYISYDVVSVQPLQFPLERVLFFYVVWKVDRDLKPANLLLLSDCQLRITDFGLSRRIKNTSSPSADVKLTKDDAADDEFSLTGCTFFLKQSTV